jgi:hypothetical protein
VTLDPGAERAVEDQHALVEGIEEVGHYPPGYRRDNGVLSAETAPG